MFGIISESGRNGNVSVLDFGSSLRSPPLPLKNPGQSAPAHAARIIRLGTVHQIADGINLQRLIQQVRQRQLVAFTVRVVVLQPPIKMIRRNDHRDRVSAAPVVFIFASGIR